MRTIKVITCPSCNSDDIQWGASVYWDEALQSFQIEGIKSLSLGVCVDCGAEFNNATEKSISIPFEDQLNHKQIETALKAVYGKQICDFSNKTNGINFIIYNESFHLELIELTGDIMIIRNQLSVTFNTNDMDENIIIARIVKEIESLF